MINDRLKFLLIQATMPEEAFGWIIAHALRTFPDGLGGFKPESRKSIELYKKEANYYIENFKE